MFNIALCIIALLLAIFGTEKIFTYFYKNPCPDRTQLLFGGVLVFLSGSLLPFMSQPIEIHALWAVYSTVLGYFVIVYDSIVRK